MSIFEKLKLSLILNYLKQASTWRGLVSVAVSAGLLHLSQEAQDALVALFMQIVALGEGLKGTINIVRNEKPLPWLAKR